MKFQKKYYSQLDLEMLEILEENLKNFENDVKSGDKDFLTIAGIGAFPKIITMIHNLAGARELIDKAETEGQRMVNDYLKERISCSKGHEYEKFNVVDEAKDETSGYTCNVYNCTICNEYFAFPIPNNYHEYVLFLESEYLNKLKQFNEFKKEGMDKNEQKMVEGIMKNFASVVKDHKISDGKIEDKKAEVVMGEKQIEMMFNALTKGVDYSDLN